MSGSSTVTNLYFPQFMTAVIDPAVLKTPGGSTVLETLQKSEVKYEIVPQPLPNTVTFWREVTEVTETEPLQVPWGEHRWGCLGYKSCSVIVLEFDNHLDPRISLMNVLILELLANSECICIYHLVF